MTILKKEVPSTLFTSLQTIYYQIALIPLHFILKIMSNAHHKNIIPVETVFSLNLDNGIVGIVSLILLFLTKTLNY